VNGVVTGSVVRHVAALPVGTLELFREVAVGIVGAALLAGVVGLLVGAGYRRTTTRRLPVGAATVVGLAAVAAFLWTVAFRSGAFVGGVTLDGPATAGYLLGTVLLGAVLAAGGGRLGDGIVRQAADVRTIDADGEAAAAVRSARLAVSVELPEAVERATGYRPVEPSVRRALSGATVRLPCGLSADERRGRIERHVERDYGVDHAAVYVAADGTIDRLAVGRRRSGLGSTLPPGTVGVAIHADPPPASAAGDPVEIRTDGGRLVSTGRLRATDGSVATVAVDADRVPDLPAGRRHRLVALPDEPTDGYEFVSTIRGVTETVVAVTVEADGPLDGEFVGWLPGRPLVVDREDGPTALPGDGETLRAGDHLWLLGTPDELAAVDGRRPATVEDGW